MRNLKNQERVQVFNNAVAAGDANERREQGLAVPKGGSKASVEALPGFREEVNSATCSVGKLHKV